MIRSSAPAGYLLLEDGARFDGETLFGNAPSLGEAVFNTSHSGYQEILTDPSYFGQIMTFTAPHIGNVGINPEDMESGGLKAAGAVVRSLAPEPRSWRSKESLTDWMIGEGGGLLVGAHTRSITLHLRDVGAQRAGLFESSTPVSEALEIVRASRDMNGADLASEVTCEKPWTFDGSGLDETWYPKSEIGAGLKIAVLDFGVKLNILRELTRRGAGVTVLPASTKADEIVAGGFDGVLLSNGPGDPAAVTYGVETTKTLLEMGIPIYGICLGHQILALAAGFSTYKLQFGHRGANHPVRREGDQAVEITSQNHGFAVTSEVAGAEGDARGYGNETRGRTPGHPAEDLTLSLPGLTGQSRNPTLKGRATHPTIGIDSLDTRLAGQPGHTSNKRMSANAASLRGTAESGDEAISQLSTESCEWEITHINLNDKTVEGLAHKSFPAFSIQYHPEASPGPHEGWTYFDQFLTMCRK